MKNFTYIRSIPIAAIFCCTLSAATTYDFRTVDIQGAQGTFLNAINDAGEIGGHFISANAPKSFLETGSGQVTVVGPVPGDPPGQVSGLSNSGTALVSDGQGGFIRQANGSTKLIPATGFAGGVFLNGMSNNGVIVGGGFTRTGSEVGIIVSNGLVQQVNIHGNPVQLNGINDAGVIVGIADGSGFVLTPNGTFTRIAVPGSLPINTTPWAINDQGVIAGTFGIPGGNSEGFIRNTDGTYSIISDPLGGSTFINGINDLGDVVGDFIDSTGVHGFEATPALAPEPAFFVPVALALASMLLGARYRRRRG